MPRSGTMGAGSRSGWRDAKSDKMGAGRQSGWHDAKPKVCYIPFGNKETTKIGASWTRKRWPMIYHAEGALRGEQAVFVIAEGMRHRDGSITAESARSKDGVKAEKLTPEALAARLKAAGLENGAILELSICKAGAGLSGDGRTFAGQLGKALGSKYGKCKIIAYTESVKSGEDGLHVRGTNSTRENANFQVEITPT